MLASATAATSISPVLVIGAGLLLLGSVLMMAAPLSFYDTKGWKDEMERWGRISSFAGSVAVLYGAVEELGSGANAVALIVLLVVAFVMAALLLVPFISWSRRARLKQLVPWLRGQVEQREGEKAPGEPGHDQEGAVADRGSAEQEVENGGKPEDGTAGGDDPEPSRR